MYWVKSSLKILESAAERIKVFAVSIIKKIISMQPTAKEGKTRLKYKAGAFELPQQQPQPDAYFGTGYVPVGPSQQTAAFGLPYIAPFTDMYANRYGNAEYVEEVVHKIAPKK